VNRFGVEGPISTAELRVKTTEQSGARGVRKSGLRARGLEAVFAL